MYTLSLLQYRLLRCFDPSHTSVHVSLDTVRNLSSELSGWVRNGSHPPTGSPLSEIFRDYCTGEYTIPRTLIEDVIFDLKEIEIHP